MVRNDSPSELHLATNTGRSEANMSWERMGIHFEGRCGFASSGFTLPEAKACLVWWQQVACGHSGSPACCTYPPSTHYSPELAVQNKSQSDRCDNIEGFFASPISDAAQQAGVPWRWAFHHRDLGGSSCSVPYNNTRVFFQ